MGTLDRWREDARLEVVITTAALDEAGKSAWCRKQGVYPGELDKWRASCAAALAEPEEALASRQAMRNLEPPESSIYARRFAVSRGGRPSIDYCIGDGDQADLAL